MTLSTSMNAIKPSPQTQGSSFQTNETNIQKIITKQKYFSFLSHFINLNEFAKPASALDADWFNIRFCYSGFAKICMN